LRGEKDRDERPEAGLYVGDTEDEPIKPAQAARRRRQRRFGCVRLLVGRLGRRIAAAALVRTVAEAA
jgi:hypothetical protein